MPINRFIVWPADRAFVKVQSISTQWTLTKSYRALAGRKSEAIVNDIAVWTHCLHVPKYISTNDYHLLVKGWDNRGHMYWWSQGWWYFCSRLWKNVTQRKCPHVLFIANLDCNGSANIFWDSCEHCKTNAVFISASMKGGSDSALDVNVQLLIEKSPVK